jgi:hypothetical protein
MATQSNGWHDDTPTKDDLRRQLAAADERDAAFDRAREAWKILQVMGYVVPWDQDGANYQDILDTYFNPAKEG